MTAETGSIIRIWRKRREFNQTDAAAYAGISTRHLSFIENGRTKPSATTLKSIAMALHMPESDKNKLLLAAGFAPERRARDVSEQEYERAHGVFSHELDDCGERPAFVADECWGVINQNEAFTRLIDPLVTKGDLPPVDQANFAHLVFHPKGLRQIILNWHNFSAFFMLLLRAESIDKPAKHEFHQLITHVHPWSEDQDGADILEPYALSAIAMPIIFSAPNGESEKYNFTTFCIAAPSPSPVTSIRMGKFFRIT